MVMVPGADEGSARHLAAQILESIRSGLIREDVPISLDAFVALCVCPAHGKEADVLLRRLDSALCDARALATSVVVYQPGREEGHRRQLAILGDLRRAIAKGELSLHYQPKVDMATKQRYEASKPWCAGIIRAMEPFHRENSYPWRSAPAASSC